MAEPIDNFIPFKKLEISPGYQRFFSLISFVYLSIYLSIYIHHTLPPTNYQYPTIPTIHHPVRHPSTIRITNQPFSTVLLERGQLRLDTTSKAMAGN
jgi:hypothetical protein